MIQDITITSVMVEAVHYNRLNNMYIKPHFNRNEVFVFQTFFSPLEERAQFFASCSLR